MVILKATSFLDEFKMDTRGTCNITIVIVMASARESGSCVVEYITLIMWRLI